MPRGHAGPAYLATAVSFANHWMTTDRYSLGADHLTARFNAQNYGARAEAGYRFGTPMIGITPYAAGQAQSLQTPNYTETDVTGGGFGLAYAAQTASDLRSELGARFDALTVIGASSAIVWRARAAWAHDWVSDPSLLATFTALPGANFTVTGATPAANSALASAGAELRVTPQLHSPPNSTASSPAARRPTPAPAPCAMCGERVMKRPRESGTEISDCHRQGARLAFAATFSGAARGRAR